jgi:MFS family permease
MEPEHPSDIPPRAPRDAPSRLHKKATPDRGGEEKMTLALPASPDRWLTGLWRNPDFVKLWGSLTITHFGGQVTFLALPLTAALLLDASPFEVGVLTALEALPFTLFGLFAGVYIDRTRKLPVIIGADLGRALALAVVPVCAWMGVLRAGALVVGFLVGLGSVIGWPAYQVFMTERVGRDNLVEANAKIGISDSAAAGGPNSGRLIQWLTAPVAILLDALSFIVSVMLRGIPAAATDAPAVRGASGARSARVAVWCNHAAGLAWSLAAWQIPATPSSWILQARDLGSRPATWRASCSGVGSPLGAVAPQRALRLRSDDAYARAAPAWPGSSWVPPREGTSPPP